MQSVSEFCWALSYRFLVFAEKALPMKGLWFGIRFRMECQRRHGPFQREFVKKVYQGGAPRTLGGPFAGMRYFDGTFFGPVTPRWLGSYEEALHPVISEVIAKKYGTVIDVGSAEGYYAIGFARAMPASDVYSFDTDPVSRSQQRKLIALNSVTNLQLGGFCSHEFLGSTGFKTPVFLLVDIEGWEYELLDPARCPALAGMDILAELHDGFGLTYEQMIECLSDRFSATHAIERIVDGARHPGDYAALAGQQLDEAELAEAINEYRPWQNSWLYLRKREAAGR
jgi:hypothetical protein